MELDISKVMELLPHRYPFLLVDRVVELERGKSLSAIKNVTINEPFFQGHFPGQPIMPGVLILEALAQATDFSSFRTLAAQEAETGFREKGARQERFFREGRATAEGTEPVDG